MQTKGLPDRCQYGRRQAGYTQEQAALLLGWSVKRLSEYENKVKNQLHPYIELAKLYGVSLDWLIIGAPNTRGSQEPMLTLLISYWLGMSKPLQQAIFKTVQRLKKEMDKK